jgi:tRNA modification GTPase
MNLANLSKQDTIIAPSTAPGMGAIAVIRISGPEAFAAVEKVFHFPKKQKELSALPSHTTHFGFIKEGEKVIDEVVITLFEKGKSYTGEETVEISCHGSTYITQKIIKLLLQDASIRLADPGEFTMRAYRNGKFDLAQAEAVADLIHSTSEASAQVALQQMRGGFSNKIKDLRTQLLNFASLIELELDFSEEDVEFADRTQFFELLNRIQKLLKELIQSFEWGNAIKNGIPIAIVGAPNAGKSTLLNAIFNEERAIVSDIEGTTRDTIEDTIRLGGLEFRFIDTAGIRQTTDEIESQGIQRALSKIDQAKVVFHLIDTPKFLRKYLNPTKALEDLYKEYYDKFSGSKTVYLLLNKADQISDEQLEPLLSIKNFTEVFECSAKQKLGVDEILTQLTSYATQAQQQESDIIVTNQRHVSAMESALEHIQQVVTAMESGVPGDLLAIDIRAALQSLGSITGEITNDELLGNIFSKFCIGK